MCGCGMPSSVGSQNAQPTLTGSCTIPFPCLSCRTRHPHHCCRCSCHCALVILIVIMACKIITNPQQYQKQSKLSPNLHTFLAGMGKIRGSSLPVSESCSTSRVRNLAKRAVYGGMMRFKAIQVYQILLRR